MLKALRADVIILPNERTEFVTETGIVLDKNFNPELGLRRGKVIAIGDKCKEIRVGDEACYMAYSGRPLTYEGVTYKVMMEDEVVGKTV
jgi:co-chaperonin GroES (HSP10)